MPKLSKDAAVEVKLDTGAAFLDAAISPEQARGLFEAPGTTVVAIVELTSKSYTGHADGEDKDPQVKVRITGCEVARSDEEAAALLEAKRAMWRGRKIDGTLDEIGNGPRGAETVLTGLIDGYPSESEFQNAEKARNDRTRHDFVR